jgi:hypothetical protein
MNVPLLSSPFSFSSSSPETLSQPQEGTGDLFLLFGALQISGHGKIQRTFLPLLVPAIVLLLFLSFFLRALLCSSFLDTRRFITRHNVAPLLCAFLTS